MLLEHAKLGLSFRPIGSFLLTVSSFCVSSYELASIKFTDPDVIATFNDHEPDLDNDHLTRRQKDVEECEHSSVNDDIVIAKFGKKQQLKLRAELSTTQLSSYLIHISVSSVIATASCTLWTFSRENGLPYFSWLVEVDPNTSLPINAIIVTISTNVLLALISVGSMTAFGAFYSVVLAEYYSSFLLAASIMLQTSHDPSV